MTPAEARTIIEAIGVSHPQVYERAGIAMQGLYQQLSTRRTLDVTERLAAVILRLERRFIATADRIATDYLNEPEAEVLYWHTSDAGFAAAVPELKGWPLTAQGLLLAEVRRRLDRPVRIEWAMDAQTIARRDEQARKRRERAAKLRRERKPQHA